MDIVYQWQPWAYSHQVWLEVAKKINMPSTAVKWLFSFKDMFEYVTENKGSLWIVPIENSYAGSVHENFFNLVKYPVKIIGEYYLPIEHCLVGTGSDLNKVKKAYSHYQALMQCENYLEKHNIQPVIWVDTAGSAKFVKEKSDPTLAAISSELAAKIYWLNILDRKINDQKGNTTRFFIISHRDSPISLVSNFTKKSLVFKVKDMPAVLYKCLWAFATRWINLTKIESIPTQEKKFEYMFWIDLELPKNEKILEEALNELWFFAKEVKLLGKY